MLCTLRSFQYLQGKDVAASQESDSAKDEVNKVEDVLIKVIRVLANLSISEDVGKAIAASDQLMSDLMSVVGKMAERFFISVIFTYLDLLLQEEQRPVVMVRQGTQLSSLYSSRGDCFAAFLV